jgi:hypothetical protein
MNPEKHPTAASSAVKTCDKEVFGLLHIGKLVHASTAVIMRIIS